MFEGAGATARAGSPLQDRRAQRRLPTLQIYRMEPAADQSALTEAVLETIRANEFKACYIRPLVYRGYNELGVNPFPCPVESAILCWEWGAYLGQGGLENGVDARVSSWNRAAPNTFPTLAELRDSELTALKMEAKHRGLSEASSST